MIPFVPESGAPGGMTRPTGLLTGTARAIGTAASGTKERREIVADSELRAPGGMLYQVRMVRPAYGYWKLHVCPRSKAVFELHKIDIALLSEELGGR